MYSHLFLNEKPFEELEFINVSAYSDKIEYDLLDSQFDSIKDTDVQQMKRDGIKLPSNFWIKGTTDDQPPLSVLAGINFIYPDICGELIDSLNSNLSLSLTTKEVFLAKTIRSTFRHTDYPSRLGTINCFLKNAEFAVTEFFTDSAVPNPFAVLAAETGKCYTVNTSIQHRVIQPPHLGTRYFLMVKIPIL